MLKNKLTEADKLKTKEKINNFDPSSDESLAEMKEDSSLFAFHLLKDIKGNPFSVFPYQDIILNDKSHKILLCIARQTGKSTIASIKALHAAFFNDNFTVVVISRTKDQSIELVRRMKTFMQTSILPWSATYPRSKEAKTEIQIKNKRKKTYSRIISVPATDAARGYTADLVICDECAFWENGDYIFNQVIEPMTQFTKGKIMLLSTPNGKRGFFWNCYNSKYWNRYQFGWEVCPINTKEEMEEKKTRMTSMEFQAEYEARFVASKNAYFNPIDIKRAIDPNLIMGHITEGNLVVGVDFGKINDYAVIYIGHVENPNDQPSEQIIKVLDRREKPLGTNYAAIIGELKAINEQYHPKLFVLDATGVGEGPADVLREFGAIVESVKFSIQSKIDIFSNLKIFLEQGRIKIPDELKLRDQLELFEYEYTLHGNMVLHAPEGAHDDENDSLALMVWGLSRANTVPVGLSVVTDKSDKEIECRHEKLKHDSQGELICELCGEYL